MSQKYKAPYLPIAWPDWFLDNQFRPIVDQFDKFLHVNRIGYDPMGLNYFPIASAETCSINFIFGYRLSLQEDKLSSYTCAYALNESGRIRFSTLTGQLAIGSCQFWDVNNQKAYDISQEWSDWSNELIQKWDLYKLDNKL